MAITTRPFSSSCAHASCSISLADGTVTWSEWYRTARVSPTPSKISVPVWCICEIWPCLTVCSLLSTAPNSIPRLWSPRQTPKVGRISSSSKCQRSRTTPISAGLSGEPGPGPTTMAEKCLRCGRSCWMDRSSFLIIWIWQFGIDRRHSAAKLFLLETRII